MKKLLILMFCVLAAPLSYAESISEQEAYKIAQQFMQDKFETAMPNAQKQRKALKSKRVAAVQKNLYIFNAEAGGGFVIVSGDDRTLAILGYSDRGEIDTENLPCNVKWLLDSYDSAIASLDGNSEATAAAKASSSITAIEPLIDTQWGQGSPYNDLCPQVAGGEHCVTGCVATAMAQIINYNRWPQEATSAITAYTSESNSISMPELPAYTFDWNNMGDNAKARLMLYCGQSVKMDYGTGGSGAYVSDVASALQDAFGYSKSTSYKSRGSDSSEEWDDMLYDELSAGRPVLFGGQSSTGGHAFVVDGCDSDGQYHINWGWDGYCDGYFTLDDLDPTGSGGFNSNQEIVYNIAPPADASDITRPKAVVTQMAASSSSLERTSASVDFASLTISSTLQSDMNETATIQVGLALYNDDGLVKVLSSGSHEFTTAESYTYEASVTIDSSIPQGEYRIVAINRSSDSDEWLADAGSSEVYISVTVNETGLLLNVLPSGSEDEYYIDFGTHTIDGITYHLYSEYENNRATVMPLSDNEKYSGNIYIPDSVSFQNILFDIVETDYNAFTSCEDLISLSVGSRRVGSIDGCKNLQTLEYREGVLTAEYVWSNEALQSLTIPSTLSTFNFPAYCFNLKTITFKNKKSFVIYGVDRLTKDINPSLTDIYFASDIPPTIEEVTVDASQTKDITIHIPSGTLDAYNKTAWKNWTLVEDQPAIPVNVHWDYCGNDEDASCGFAMGRGDNNVEIAMRIPANCLTAYKGCEISAVEFYTTLPSTNDWHYEDIEYVFVTTEGTDYLARKSVNTIRGTWMTVEFDQPYVITGEALYVGLGKYSTIGADWANLDVVDDGCWSRVMGTDTNYGMVPGLWEKHLGFSTGWNYTLPIRAIIKGDKLPTDVVIANVELIDGSEQQSDAKSLTKANGSANTPAKVSSLDANGGYFNYTIDAQGNYYVAQQSQCATQPVHKATANDKKQLKVKLRNRTPKTVKQVTLDWDIDGKHQGQQTIETVMLLNHEDNVYLDIPSNISGRNHTMTVNVSSIDGEADEIPVNSTDSVKFSTEASSFFPRKIVMEEVTGTWCGYCPRGIVGIEKLYEKYPDNFIAIAVHDDSKMWPVAYDSLFAMVSSVPTSYINRTEWEDPQSFAYEDDKIQEMLLNGVASITAQASFVEGEEKIKVSTESQFGFDDDGSTEYRIAYVLVEDSVGPYDQYNYYSDPTAADDPSDDMNWWIHQESPVSTLYNDVARQIYDDYYGVSGSLPTVVKEGETYKSEYTLTLPENVQNVKNLKIVTLLIDNTTGEILNADRTSISGEPYVKPYYSRKIVMEEGTGSWCGWCPRGIVAIDLMKEKYPDNFIPIAIHRSDKMSPADGCYNSYFSMVSGYPTSYINRTQWMDPSSMLYYDMDGNMDKANASIKINASFNATDETKIDVNAESVFNFSSDTTEYRIAYVLLEDNVGPYNQSNSYSDPSAATDDSNMMDWWIHQGSSVSTIYNDVARKIYDDYYGVEDQLPKEIKVGETYKSEYALTLPSNVQNSHNLKVVALLLDTSTGEILNADRTSISGTPPSGIATVTTDLDEHFDVYNLQGVKVGVGASSLKGLPQGVYIVNGKKVLVK